ncbi:MAG TPA: MoxR family ATPase [Candidatus Hydrogenedentes bacterium]|nr:MoxR family ATPase [Candidatus Hydrogenedentota bacterium]
MHQQMEYLHQILDQVRTEAGKVIIGQRDALDQALITILAGGHALVEGVPGIAKTMLVRTLAHLLGCEFQRVQFTHDLAPKSITGTHIYNEQAGVYELVKGPLFSGFLLADEINRAPAITQAALLQAMQERRVTIDRQTYALSPNFCVFATQNPVESVGVYPLPEAQKDRFLLKIVMGYPSQDEEQLLAARTLTRDAPEILLDLGIVQPLLTEERLVQLREALSGITVPKTILRYIVELVRVTRNHTSVKVGAGPRATQALVLTSRAHAALSGRTEVGAEDVRAMALPCLEHRLILKPDFEEKGLTCAETVHHVVSSVPTP